MFVLDASARLTGNYNELRNYEFKVVQMEPAQVSYANLDIEWWDKGCGQTVLSTAKERATIIAAVAELVNSKSSESWLIVHRKSFGRPEVDGSTSIPEDLQKLILEPSRVRSVTWGRHLGSNAFRDIPNVIIMGSYGYGGGAYDALHLAIAGQAEGLVTNEQRRAREDAEFCHNLYQAVCRSRVRQQQDGVCSRASAYLIMTRNEHRESLVARCFPDSTVRMWQPVQPVKKSKSQHVIDVLETKFANRTIIRKQDIIEACGGNDRSYLDKVFRGSAFKAYAKAKGLVRKGGYIFRNSPSSIAA
jgi:hypothetical protein